MFELALLLVSLASAPLSPGEAEVLFMYRAFADEDKGQCGYAQGVVATPLSQWSKPLYVSTDNRPGGCKHALALLDTQGRLAGMTIRLRFESFGEEAQCDEVGWHVVTPSSDAGHIKWTETVRIDSDDRNGGCEFEFEIQGHDDVYLDIEVTPDGEATQCGGAKRTLTAHKEKSATFRIATDERIGGCYLRYRLREMPPSNLPGDS